MQTEDKLNEIYEDMLEEKKGGNKVSAGIDIFVMIDNVPTDVDGVDFDAAEKMMNPLLKKLKSVKVPGMKIQSVKSSGDMDDEGEMK